MHELAIAEALLEQVLHIAQANNASSVTHIEVELGAMRMVVPDALEEGFKALSRGTLAENAQFSPIEIPITVQCRRCKQQFHGEMGCFLCPQCKTGDVEVIAGDDIILKAVECEIKGK